MKSFKDYLFGEETLVSLNILRGIQDSIDERSFHLQNHIIYDCIDLVEKNSVSYMEIGSYCGASASLAASHAKTSYVRCIDPMSLNKSHYGGSLSQEDTFLKNFGKYRRDDCRFKLFKGFSQDLGIVNQVHMIEDGIDVLFIDGDHSENGVLSDWSNYSPIVNRGGFIIFDDYYDFEHSAGVKKAVDRIVSQRTISMDYDIIGCPPNVHNMKFHRKNDTDKISSFVLYKRLR